MSKSTELGFLTSQLSGVKISHGYSDVINRIALPSAPSLQYIVARRICPFTGKKANRANKVFILKPQDQEVTIRQLAIQKKFGGKLENVLSNFVYQLRP